MRNKDKMHPIGIASLVVCAWLMLVTRIQHASAAMCGNKPYHPPGTNCCGYGKQNIVFNTVTEMCLQDIYSQIYHTRSKFFPCGNLSQQYNYLTQLCIMEINTSIYRIIPRYAYCGPTRYDRRYFNCIWDFMTGRDYLEPRRKRSMRKRSKNGLMKLKMN